MSSKFIAFNSDQDIWFGENNPQLSAMNALEEKFSKDKNVFIAIEAKDGKIFSQETVTTIEELIADAWKLRKWMSMNQIIISTLSYIEDRW